MQENKSQDTAKKIKTQIDPRVEVENKTRAGNETRPSALVENYGCDQEP